jgi:hypothetical protein
VSGFAFFHTVSWNMERYMRILEWQSGDCKPVLAVHPSLEDLSSRHELQIFRDQDDLDWFIGALFLEDQIGQVLIMRHGGDPEKTTDFYVDSAFSEDQAIKKILELFRIKDDEVFWRLDTEERG